MIVYCDDTTCSYNEDGYCEADRIEIGGMCLSYRGKVEEESEDSDNA